MNFAEQIVFFVPLMVGLLMASGFFSSTETALFSLTPEMARRFSKKPQIYKILLVLQESPAELLSCILFGNLIVNILFFCTGAAVANYWGEVHGEWFEVLGGFIVLLVVILFGEILPKAAGVNHSFHVLTFFSAPLRFWFRLTRYLLRPLRLLEGGESAETELTSEEFRELLNTVRHEPDFGSHEKTVLEDIVALPEIRVREVFVPRFELLRKPATLSCQDVLDAACQGGYKYVVLYDENEEDLLGYVKTSDLFFSEADVDSIDKWVQPFIFVPETKRIDVLLREFMKNKWDLVAVVDEYGGFSGVVGLEDLFSEVVGEMDEDSDEQIVQIDDLTYRLKGRLPIRVWRELFPEVVRDWSRDEMAYDTLGGLVVSLLGRVPCSGDQVAIRNLRLTVESVKHHRIESVLLNLDSTEKVL